MCEVIFKEDSLIGTANKSVQLGQKPMVVWITGLSGAGKSTLAKGLEAFLFGKGIATVLLDGDNMRRGLCADLGFSETDRDENIRRVASTAKLFLDAGMSCIAAFVSPLEKHRDMVREVVGSDNFFEVYMSTPLEVCMQRDKKELYKRAMDGEIDFFPGINSVFEPPLNPDMAFDSSKADSSTMVAELGYRIKSIVALNDK